VSATEPKSRRFRPYPAYKDSGIEWLGRIPTHWTVKRLKTLASVRLSNVDKKSLEGEQPVRLCNYTDVYYNERITSDLEFMHATATGEQVRTFTLRAGDVLVTKDSESWTDIAVPAVVKENLEGVLCGYHLAHIRPATYCHGPFLARAFSALGTRDQFQIAASGITRFGLGGDAIRGGLFAMPPEPEQRTIAAFLDRETAKIDALVAKKERLIELLQERRTALITRAVTGGLDPGAPTRDSGIEWLDEIPARWAILPLKRLWRRCDYGLSESLAGTGAVRVLTMAHIQDGEVVLPKQGSMDDVPAALLLDQDDLLFNRTNSRDLVGKVGLFRGSREEHVSFASYLVRLTANRRAWPAYLNLLLNCRLVLAQARSMALLSVNQANLNPSRYGEIRVPLPDLDEQVYIVRWVHDRVTSLRHAAERVRRAIDLLQELRAALISAAVTGKIDVRGDVSA